MKSKKLLQQIAEHNFKVQTIKIDLEGFNYDALNDNQKSSLIHLLEIGGDLKENNDKLLPDFES